MFADLLHNNATASRVTEGIETLEGVTDERQAEVGVVGLTSSLGRSAHLRRCVDLGNLVDGEVLGVDGAAELGLEGSADFTETVPVDTAEEGVFLEFLGAAHMTKAVSGLADEAVTMLAGNSAEGSGWTYPRMKCSDSGLSCWSGGKVRYLCQSTILR